MVSPEEAMFVARPERKVTQAPAEAPTARISIRGGSGNSTGRRTGPRRKRRARPAEEEEQLTERERQVLLLLAQGFGTGAIAQRLSISMTTVRNHSQRILAKLRAHSRIQAVAVGYASGLIPVPASMPRPREKEEK
jgi:DNA-binding NarL/FixJ family response regulator